MPISIIVGGQFGSEGKGKVSLEIATRFDAKYVVRVGGTNSGHTVVDSNEAVRALRQLPAAVLSSSAVCVLPAGSLIDPVVLFSEIEELRLDPSRVAISPYATIISDEDKRSELAAGLTESIGSTGSGTGAALIRRMGRSGRGVILAQDHPALQQFLTDTSAMMRAALKKDHWIVIEGTQGFGLSLLHGGYYPNATSRDTTAAAFLSETGLSPMDVKDVTLVIRAHPIRVAGNSGELRGETSWPQIAKTAGLPIGYCELTTATKKVRRVGSFDPALVVRAIEANSPTRIVLNHFDYVDADVRNRIFSEKACCFLNGLEMSIGRAVDWVGIGPRQGDILERQDVPRLLHSRKTEVAAPVGRKKNFNPAL